MRFLLLLVVVCPALVCAGLAYLRRRVGRRPLRPLELRPMDGAKLDLEAWKVFFQSLYAITPPPWKRWLLGLPHVGFELAGEHGRVRVRCWLPDELVPLVTTALRTACPGISVRAGSQLPDQGLYHWVGEESCRLTYRGRGDALSPDGWGRYLTAAGEITFMVEWDRGTESPRRLRDKVQTYARHFTGRDDAHLNHVLFVVPNRAREETLTAIIAALRQPRRQRACCSFWTADARTLREDGVLAAIWRDDDHGSRLPLRAISAHPRSPRLAAHSVAKPGWWEHRPGGSEGA